MPIYNYDKENDVQNDKYPLNTHLVFEVSSSLIYFVDASDPTILLKTTDEGVTVTVVDVIAGVGTSRTKNIARAWHDRDNNLIYFVDCDYDNGTSYIWSLNTSTEAVVEIASLPADIFDIWIYDDNLYYDYFASSYDITSTYIEPEGDGSTVDWNTSTGSTHYTLIDEGATPATGDYIETDVADEEEIIEFYPNSFDITGYDYYINEGAASQIYEIEAKIYAAGGKVTIDGNLTGMTEQEIEINKTSSAHEWYSAVFSGLDLQDTDMDSLELTINNIYYGGSHLNEQLNSWAKASDFDDPYGGIRCIIWDGTYYHVVGGWYDDMRCVKYNSSWSKQSTTSNLHLKNQGGSWYGGCWDGTYFYVTDGSYTIYQYNTSWVEQNTFSAGSYPACAAGIAFDGTDFFIGGCDQKVRRYNSSFIVQEVINTSGDVDNNIYHISYDTVHDVFWLSTNNYEYMYDSSWNLLGSWDISSYHDGVCVVSDTYWYNWSAYNIKQRIMPFAEIATLRVEVKHYGNTQTDLVIKEHGETPESEDMGNITGRNWRSSQIVNHDDQFWFLWRWSDDDVELWKYDISTTTFTNMEDCGATTEIPPDQQGGIAYDEDDRFSFVLGTGTKEVSTILAKDDSLIGGGDYITYSAIEVDSKGIRTEKDYYIWFDQNGDGTTEDPAPADKTAIWVDISSATTDQNVSDAIESAVDAVTLIGCDNAGGLTCTLTNHYNGNVTDIADVDTTMTCTKVTDGVDNTYYYHTYDITGDTLTKGGEYNAALMLNRNTDASNDVPFNLEKGFHLTGRYVYQIDSGGRNLWKISDLSNSVADGTIVAITDSYLFIKRTSNDIELWKFQDFAAFLLEVEMFHAERDYATATIMYRSDKYYLEEGMFIQIIGETTNSIDGTVTDVQFEGYVLKPEDLNDEAVNFKVADLVNPALYDLLKSYSGELTGDSDDYLDLIIPTFNYISKGVFDAGQTLETISYSSNKANLVLMNQLAVGDEFTWRIRPTGELDYTDGTNDSGVNYDQDTPVWNVEVSDKIIVPNSITVKGAYVGGIQIISTSAYGQDLASQQINGIIEEEIVVSWLTTEALANIYADAILGRLGITFREIVFSVRDETNGMIPPGEEITFAYTHKNITSDQYKINQVIYDHKNLAAEYTISSIVRWDIEELQDIQTDELSEQVSQVAETTTINTPVGTILIWSTDTAPEGWLLCDGSAINRDDYADLFAVIGETFGDGNNSTTFEIPDFEGRFLRGVDNDAARDPDRATRTAMNPGGNTGDNVGSVQGHAFDSHEHSFDESYWAPGSAAGVWIPGWNGHYTWRNRNTDNMSGGVASSETRPLNAYVNFIIKY